MAPGWVPTNNANCDYLSAEVDVNPNYFVDNMRPPASNPHLFPLITKTCKSPVIVPAVHQAVGDVSTQTRSQWAFAARDQVCASTGAEGWTFTPLRGVPLLGDWVLANTLDNAQLIARYSRDTSPTTPPPASFATSNANVTAVRVLISAMAEPSASQGPTVYTLLTQAPPASAL
jgi:hypothetical protein